MLISMLRSYGKTPALVAVMGAMCCSCIPPASMCNDETTVHLTLVNGSTTQLVVPNIGVCPNGMENEPHHFVATPPVLAPGEEITYTACQLAGADGNCFTFDTAFSIGLCGWSYGPSEDELSGTRTRFGGQIGMQFNCGDTIILRWTETENAWGAWSSEVVPAPDNDPPAAEFQVM